MRAEQMKQRAAKLSEVAYTDCTPRIHREMLAILRAVAGGEVQQVRAGHLEWVYLQRLHDVCEGKAKSADFDVLVIQGGEDGSA